MTSALKLDLQSVELIWHDTQPILDEAIARTHRHTNRTRTILDR